jgi:hypothetical protein
MNNHSVALLPTQTNINLHSPESNEYFTSDLTYLVLRQQGSYKTSIASTYATAENPTAGHVLGERWEAHHDQAMYSFGTLVVIGMRTREGVLSGDVPERKLSLRVFK